MYTQKFFRYFQLMIQMAYFLMKEFKLRLNPFKSEILRHL